MYNQLKKILLEAIRYPRPPKIQNVCLPVWNQPFFYKVDKAHALTISYNPTDKGAKRNYPEQVACYKENGYIEAEEIFELLYNFKKENYWRKYYDLLFSELGIDSENIAHMDMSIFPYRTLNDCLNNKCIDDSKKYLVEVVELLSDNLKFILIDGAKNKDIVNLFVKDYILIDSTILPINSSKRLHKLYIYKHKIKSTFLIYFGCFLYGHTCPSEEYVKKLAKYIKVKTSFSKGVQLSGMKLCQKCELNYINDNDELCAVCKASSKISSGGSKVHKKRSSVYFNEDFTFSNESATYRGKRGFKAYNSYGENVGIVFMTDDKRSPAYECCELCFYSNYQNRYHEWHRFTSYGCRLKWEVLCMKLKTLTVYKCHID